MDINIRINSIILRSIEVYVSMKRMVGLIWIIINQIQFNNGVHSKARRKYSNGI